MAQITTGFRSVLSVPSAYNFLMRLMGAAKFERLFVGDYIRPQAGDRILDVGCGTGSILQVLPKSIDYLGIDLSASYIESATSQFGDRARFQVGDVNELQFEPGDPYDIVMAIGLLHHLNDDEVVRLARSVRRLLRPGGRFLTIDNCFVDGQSPVARTLIRWDRGQNVRTSALYCTLLSEVFGKVTHEVRHDLLHIPYSHVILESTLD